MSTLPKGWKQLRLDDAATVTLGQSPPGSTYNHLGDGLPFFQGKTEFTKTFAEVRKYTTGGTKFAQAGDILLSVRAPVGPTNLAPVDCALGRGLAGVRAKEGVNQRYLMWAIRATEHKLASRGAGSTFPAITGRQLKEHVLSVAPLHEQRRIVDVLEGHLSRLDAAQTYLDASARKADIMYQAVLHAAMQGELGAPSAGTHARTHQLELRATLRPVGMKRGRPQPVPASEKVDGWPPHWTRVSLEEATHPVRTISYGILKPGPDTDGGVPYVRVLNMRRDTLGLNDLHRTTPEIASQYERTELVPGDVLVSIRGTYGRVVIVPEALRGGNITQDAARLAFVGPVDPEFGAIYLRSPQAQSFFKRVARGVAVKGVNITDLRAMPFPIPPMMEQQAMVERVAELASEVDNARRAVRLTAERAISLRRALLDAALSGRLTGRASDMDIAEEMAGV